MIEQGDIQAALKLPPKDALSLLQAKANKPSWNWFEMLDGAHARAFTVAKCVRADVLQLIREGVDEALRDGLTFAQFQQRLAPKLKKAGWWGVQLVGGSDGELEVARLGSPHRLKTIYRTNMQVSYASGRYKAQVENLDYKPYWQYLAVRDSKTRPSHAAMHGVVFAGTDPIWQTHYPPNGWGCRCRVRAISERQFKAEGLTLTSSAGKVSTKTVDAGIDKRTGEIVQTQVATYKSPLGELTPDVGWSHNVGEAAFGTDQHLLRQLSRISDEPLRQELIQTINGAPPRKADLRNWVQAKVQRAEQFIEAKNNKDVQALKRLGVDSAPKLMQLLPQELATQTGAKALVITPTTILHSWQKHLETGILPTSAQWLALPNEGRWVFDNINNDWIWLVAMEDGYLMMPVHYRDEVLQVVSVMARPQTYVEERLAKGQWQEQN